MIEFIARLEKLLTPELVRQLKSQSLNRAVVSARAQIIRKIRETYAIKAQYLRERVFQIRKSSPTTLQAKIVVTGKKSTSLAAAYPTRQTSLGVISEIKKGKRFLIPHAFIQKGQAWRREKQGSRFVGRYPIKLLRGPLEVVLTAGVSRWALEYIVDTATKEFERRLKTVQK